jgi:hypothetical protein
MLSEHLQTIIYQPSPTFPSMSLEMVILEDEEEPVSSRTRSHASRKKLNFAEVSL